MAFTNPYKQHHYLGEIANSGSDAEVLAIIQALEWDTNKDGTGNPEDGMMYYDTTNNVLKYYGNGAWSTLGTATPPTLAAVLAQGNDTSGNDIDVNNGDDLGIESGATLTVESGGTINVPSGGTIAIADNGILTIADITDCTFTGTPVSGTDPVNKAYVDSVASGLSWKEPVIVRAQGNITLSGPGATIDGVTMSVGDRVLCDQQTTTTEDGIYAWQGAAVAMTRTSDAQVGDNFASAAMFVEQGTDADKGYVCTNDTGSAVIGTNDLTFVAFTGGGALTAGNGIDITGSTISVDLLASGGLKFTAGELGVEPADFAGSGLQDDGSDNLELKLYATKVSAVGDSDVANNPLYLDSTNGLNVKVDASTIDLDSGNGNRLYVPNGGITETQLNASVAGNGLTGGGGSALSVVAADTATKGGLTVDSDGVYSTVANAGNPNGVVNGDLGKMCLDTTNGIMYIYESTTAGNNSWRVV